MAKMKTLQAWRLRDQDSEKGVERALAQLLDPYARVGQVSLVHKRYSFL